MARENEDGRNQPMDRLKGEVGGLVGALSNRAVTSLLGKVEGTTGRLTDYVEGGAGPGLMAAVTGAKGLAEGKSPGRSMLSAGMAGAKEKISGMFRKGGKGGGGRKLKLTNIVESIDVGVPVTLAYNQWTQYNDFPKFMKKVESADKDKSDEEQKVNWKAQVFWSHRTWEAKVVEQVPDERIVWRSKGEKGHVDGAVTFHELGPNLTRILLVLEYHPQGLFERTGNLWRAQGRRARLELKHFQRHIMTQSVLHPDDIEGWRGTVHDGEVAESHEDAVEREQQDGAGRDESRQADDDQGEDETRARAESDEEPGEEDNEEAGSESDGRRGRRPAGQARPTRRASQGSTSRSGSSRSKTGQGTGRRRASATSQRGGNT
ncbi:MAG TPA: SRPBCC family protein [Streptosporangiaceae bacterium]|nr:SRPBCC family protein [Streptosporangiaceae bacterium]